MLEEKEELTEEEEAPGEKLDQTGADEEEDKEELDPDQLSQELAAVRQEAAKRRIEARKLRQEMEAMRAEAQKAKAAEEERKRQESLAELDEAKRAQEELRFAKEKADKLALQVEEAQKAAQKAKAERVAARRAEALGFRKPELAAKQVDYDYVNFDDKGVPDTEDIVDQLNEMLAEEPGLKRSDPVAERRKISRTGSSPAGDELPAPGLRLVDPKKLRPEDWQREIREAVRKGNKREAMRRAELMIKNQPVGDLYREKTGRE